MDTHLRQARRLAGTVVRHGLVGTADGGIAAHTNHQHTVGAQVQRRADRRLLPHRTVAEELAENLHRAEQQRNRRTGQQMLDLQACRHADTPVTQPRIDGGAALVEGHRLPGLVAECGDCHCAQVAAAHSGGNAGQVQFALKEIAQRGAVQQRHRLAFSQPQQAVAEELEGLAEHARPVGTVHLPGAKTLPDLGQALHRAGEGQRTAGEADGIDGAS